MVAASELLFSSDCATSIAQLAQTMSVIAAEPIQLKRNAARQGDIQVSIGDPSRANAVLGIKAETHLGTGLRAVLDELEAAEDAMALLNQSGQPDLASELPLGSRQL